MSVSVLQYRRRMFIISCLYLRIVFWNVYFVLCCLERENEFVTRNCSRHVLQTKSGERVVKEQNKTVLH